MTKTRSQELNPDVPQGWKGPKHFSHYLLLSTHIRRIVAQKLLWCCIPGTQVCRVGILRDDIIFTMPTPALLVCLASGYCWCCEWGPGPYLLLALEESLTTHKLNWNSANQEEEVCGKVGRRPSHWGKQSMGGWAFVDDQMSSPQLLICLQRSVLNHGVESVQMEVANDFALDRPVDLSKSQFSHLRCGNNTGLLWRSNKRVYVKVLYDSLGVSRKMHYEDYKSVSNIQLKEWICKVVTSGLRRRGIFGEMGHFGDSHLTFFRQLCR